MMPTTPHSKATAATAATETTDKDSLGIMDKLAAAFRSQSSITTDKEQRGGGVRSSNKSNSTNTNLPSLRKRSSGSISFYRQQDNIETTTSRRRDSNGINYSNFVSALNEYQKQTSSSSLPSSLDTTTHGLFTLKQTESNSPIKLATTPPPPSSVQLQLQQQPGSPRAKGRVQKRLSATLVNNNNNNNNNNISTTSHNPHGSTTALSKIIKETKPIEPSELGQLLDDMLPPPLLIDMRPLEQYEKFHIRHSINVNLPSLLIKRYRRGVVSNFNLESFITTPEGTEYFKKWMNLFNIQDNNIQNLPSKGAILIVYDDDMILNQEDLAVWTLMGVIAKNLTVSSNVLWLKNGFHEFEKWDFTKKYMSTELNLVFKDAPKLKIPIPMISRSATTLSSKAQQQQQQHLGQRRASLFSLNTTTLRSKSSSRLSNNGSGTGAGAGGAVTNNNRRVAAVSAVLEDHRERTFSPSTPETAMSSPDIFHTPLEQLPSALPEDEEEEEEMITPKTEGEFDFVISEIIPNFLYLGPEISDTDQLAGLKSRSIKRILNMAEECDDDIPGLKDSFLYEKIAARDTVEMKNVQGTLRKAVQVIDESKKHHEPIYVHCKAGKSRSAAAILAYLVLSEHWTLKRAYRHIVKARPNISPNIGFVAELMKLEEGVHGVVSNFTGTDWHLIDLTNPPSPDTQKEMGRLEKAWKRGRSSSSVSNRHRSLSGSSSSRQNIVFTADEKQQD